jgi:hypothetical protein
LGWRPTRSAGFLTCKRRQSYWNGTYLGFACSVTRDVSPHAKSARAGRYSIMMSRPSNSWSAAMDGQGNLSRERFVGQAFGLYQAGQSVAE